METAWKDSVLAQNEPRPVAQKSLAWECSLLMLEYRAAAKFPSASALAPVYQFLNPQNFVAYKLRTPAKAGAD